MKRDTTWRKSSRSGANGACVEARIDGTPQVRDSKLGDDSPILNMSRSDFEGLLAAAR